MRQGAAGRPNRTTVPRASGPHRTCLWSSGEGGVGPTGIGRGAWPQARPPEGAKGKGRGAPSQPARSWERERASRLRAPSAWQRRPRRQPGALPLCLSAPPASQTNGCWREAGLAREQWQERRSLDAPAQREMFGQRMQADARKVLFASGRHWLQR